MASQPSGLAVALGDERAFLLIGPALHLAIGGLFYSFAPPTWACVLFCALLFGAPLAHWLVTGTPTVWITNQVSVRADVPLLFASKFIRDVRNLEQYEQKVQGCRPEENGFTIWGAWFGIPFMKSFHMKLARDGGFHSVAKDKDDIPLPFRFRGSGGFKLELCPEDETPKILVKASWAAGAAGRVNGKGAGKGTDTAEVSVPPTRIIHYERYGWPIVFPLIVIAGPMWRCWHRRGMECEMQIIKAQCERMFLEVNTIDMDDAGAASFHAGDHAVDWTSWKYGTREFMMEGLTGLLCRPGRPYMVHHPQLTKEELDEDAIFSYAHTQSGTELA